MLSMMAVSALLPDIALSLRTPFEKLKRHSRGDRGARTVYVAGIATWLAPAGAQFTTKHIQLQSRREGAAWPLSKLAMKPVLACSVR